MLTATYRLCIGSRIRQLALLTAIGAVLNASGWDVGTLGSEQIDSISRAISGSSGGSEIRRGVTHVHPAGGGVPEEIER
jgi:hypothetical protein